jgi:hypothetical protein
MDQTAFRKAILSDPFAEDAQVLAAANSPLGYFAVPALGIWTAYAARALF